MADITRNKITDIINANSINDRTRCVLVNAFYFKGNWECKFDKNRTNKQNFHISDSEYVSIDFMSNEKYFDYAELDELDATADLKTITQFENKIGIEVIIPRFKIEYTLENLEFTLKNVRFI